MRYCSGSGLELLSDSAFNMESVSKECDISICRKTGTDTSISFHRTPSLFDQERSEIIDTHVCKRGLIRRKPRLRETSYKLLS